MFEAYIIFKAFHFAFFVSIHFSVLSTSLADEELETLQVPVLRKDSRRTLAVRTFRNSSKSEFSKSKDIQSIFKAKGQKRTKDYKKGQSRMSREWAENEQRSRGDAT
jgi:biopolymer transport protein ExbB/TolQ